MLARSVMVTVKCILVPMPSRSGLFTDHHQLSRGRRLGGADPRKGCHHLRQGQRDRSSRRHQKHSASTLPKLLVDKANYRHLQAGQAKSHERSPEVVGHTLARYVDMATDRVMLPVKLPPFDFRGYSAHFDHRLRYCELCAAALSPLNTGSNGWRACRSNWMSPSEFRYRGGAVAQGRSRDLFHFAVGRDRRHVGGLALCAGCGRRPHALRGPP